jgi:hypothetical protein
MGPSIGAGLTIPGDKGLSLGTGMSPGISEGTKGYSRGQLYDPRETHGGVVMYPRTDKFSKKRKKVTILYTYSCSFEGPNKYH